MGQKWGQKDTERQRRKSQEKVKAQDSLSLSAPWEVVGWEWGAVEPELISLAPSFHFHHYLNAYPAPNLSLVFIHTDPIKTWEVTVTLIAQLEMGSEQLNDSPNITEQLMKEKESGSRSSSLRRLSPHIAQPGILGPSAPPGGHHVT